MKKKSLLVVTLLFSVLAFALVSCSDDDQPVGNLPVIKLSEVGDGNSKEAVAGKDLHITADVFAENVIDGIYVTLQTHNGLDTLVAKSYTDSKYAGGVNAVFHEHIDVPANTPEGHYLFTFLVKDKAGKESIASSDVKVKMPTPETTE